MDNFEREVQEKRYVEGEKLLFDLFKHLTTLSTGSILLMIALLEKLFKENVHWKALVGVSFVAFIFSIAYALNAMSSVGLALQQEYETARKTKKVNMLISLMAFALGIFSLMIFALRNL